MIKKKSLRIQRARLKSMRNHGSLQARSKRNRISKKHSQVISLSQLKKRPRKVHQLKR